MKTTSTAVYLLHLKMLTQHASLLVIFLLIYPPQSLAKTPPALTKPISIEEQHKGDMNRYLPAHSISTLLVGPNSYHMLVNENKLANNKGVFILIPEWQQGVTHSNALHFLQQKLPLLGWTTIAIQPPNKPDKYPSTAINVTEQKEYNEQTIAQYSKKLSALIKAVIEKAKTFPGAVFMLSQGNNAAIISKILAKEVKNKTSSDKGNSYRIEGMILLSSYMQSNESSMDELNKNLAVSIANMELPILDITLKHDHPAVQQKADERNSLAVREMKVFYRYRMLNNSVAGTYPEQALISQIERWVISIGW